MSEAKSAHPLLAEELVTSTLNSAPLDGLLQQLLSLLSSTQADLRSLSTKHDSASQATWLELQKLKNAQEAVQARLKESEDIKRALVGAT
jgi:hypothetical protein